jgi:anti-sigma factor RsiW
MSSAPPHASHDEFEVQLSDYLDGSIGAKERQALDEHLVGCTSCQAAIAELRETMSALSGLTRMAAPENFERDVADAIRRRSRGRFFGRRALGDRVPFEVLALVALALGVALYFFLRGSDTGSLKPFDREPDGPVIHEEAPNVVPRP